MKVIIKLKVFFYQLLASSAYKFPQKLWLDGMETLILLTIKMYHKMN